MRSAQGKVMESYDILALLNTTGVDFLSKGYTFLECGFMHHIGTCGFLAFLIKILRWWK